MAERPSYESLPPAVVVRLGAIEPHPNSDHGLEVVHFTMPVDYGRHGRHEVQVVTGPHYRAGTEAVWFVPGSLLPGYLAEDLWQSHGGLFEVRAFPFRGVMSEGLIAGSRWRPKREDDFQPWRFWKGHWKPGRDVSEYLGVTRLRSSVAEHPADNREVAAKTTIEAPDPSGPGAETAVEALGSTPAAGSTPSEKTLWYGTCGYWTDDWDSLASSVNRIPLCPLCGAPGFVQAVAEWWRQVDAYEAAGHPGYRAKVEADRGKHPSRG